MPRITAERTIERASATLDPQSIVALEWTQHWAHRHGSLAVAPGVVIRRALVHYAGHLSNLDPAASAGECRHLRDAGKGSGSAVSLTEARARLERHQETYKGPEMPGPQPMGHWLDMRDSVEERRQSLAMLDRLEAHMAGAA